MSVSKLASLIYVELKDGDQVIPLSIEEYDELERWSGKRAPTAEDYKHMLIEQILGGKRLPL